jgi:hypothetical protein
MHLEVTEAGREVLPSKLANTEKLGPFGTIAKALWERKREGTKKAGK